MEKNQSKHADNEMKDKYFLTQILFYVFGVVSVIPSHYFSTATDYWLYKFRDLEGNQSYKNENKTALQAEFTADNSIVSNVGLCVAIIITVRVLRTKFTSFQRITTSLVVVLLLFVFVCIFIRLETDSWQRGFFVLTLITSCLTSVFCGIFMATIFEVAAKFPQGLLVTIFSGQAICGIFAALTQIFALGVGGGPQSTALVYFIIAVIVVFSALIIFLATYYKSEYFRYYYAKDQSLMRRKLVFRKDIVLRAFNKAKLFMIALVISLGCSVMLHPGVISLVSSVNQNSGDRWSDTFFKPVVNFLFYNTFDYIGREMAVIIKKPTNGILILIISCFRIPFVPLILLCNVQPRHHLPVVFDSDAVYIILLLIFAFSNGYLVNLSISSVPRVTNEEETPFAMLGILLLMILSLAICSPTSTAIVNAL